MLYVVSASYDSIVNGLTLRLYNDETEKIEDWTDVDFKAYFLKKEELTEKLVGVVSKEIVKKYDALNDKEIELWKISLDNPALVKQSHGMDDAYENHIKFFSSYIFDNNVKMGMPYVRDGEKLVFKDSPEITKKIEEILSKFKVTDAIEKEIFQIWTEMLEYPAPNFKRAALDIEVWNDMKNKTPVPEHAVCPVITACFASNRGERIALVLLQEGKIFEGIPDNVNQVEFFSSEKELLERLFELINQYPILITFNGDDFDLKYLFFRALRLGIPEHEIPIQVRSRISMLSNSIHIDLYKFFFIKAMKTYAFASKYKNVSLDSVSTALLGKSKIEINKPFNDLTYFELMKYCMRDVELTLELTTYDDDLAMNLIVMLQRISRLPIENVSRRNVGSWIRNFMTYEHRRRNWLIPKPEDIKAIKGGTVSEAMIKGKKYKGAKVFDPIVGIHFMVIVLDFASLYPSVMKIYNIGYSTINCPHKNCEKNTIGDLPHWICTKNKAMEAQLIGSLRDLRVDCYKKKPKDESLSKTMRNWYKVAEQSIKVIMNASYGVFGDENFIFYCPPEAEEIAGISRYATTTTSEKAQSIGLIVIYGDTDSIFIKNPPKDLLDFLIKWTKDEFGVDFEVDKVYRYVCLSNRKKNYFGVREDGSIDVKGLTGKKKHTPLIIKNPFNKTKQILSEVYNEEDMVKAKEKIIETLKTSYLTLKNRGWKDINDLAFNVTMSKEIEAYGGRKVQHVKAAQMLVDNGYNISANTNISFVKTLRQESGKKGIKMVEDVKPIQLAKKEEINVNKYLEFLRSTFEQILEPMNVSFNKEVVGITEITDWLHQK